MWTLLLLLIGPLVTRAQENDSLVVLTPDRLMWWIEQYHPVASQARLFEQKGEANLRMARGGFDPYAFSNYSQKQFKDTEYFSILAAGLKIPTWYGVEFKTGFDQNTGTYLNNENTVPDNGLWYAGASITLGQGLLMDKRRATLIKARLYAEVTDAERQRLLNDIFFEAIDVYWQWFSAHVQLEIYEEAVELANVRFEGVKQSYLQGSEPAIDTLEATIQVQNRIMSLNQAKLDYQNLTLALSNFFWDEQGQPLELSDNVIPPSLDQVPEVDILSPDSLSAILNSIEDIHPDLRIYDYKLGSLEIERKLKAEGLRPRIDLNYNFLTQPVGNNPLGGLTPENYKWGVDFSFPLFLRKQRGDLQLTRLEITDTQFARSQKQLLISNKIRLYHNEQVNLQGQVDLYRSAVINYDGLLQGERQKFATGESSLFLINSREVSLITARLKLVELIAKYHKAHFGIYWAAGSLGL